MNKLLPIKFFEKRKFDEQFTESGGPSELPKWVLLGENLEQHSKRLIEEVNIIEKIYKNHEHTLPMVIATSINKEAIAKSHRNQIVDCLNSDNNDNVIGIKFNEDKELLDINNNKNEREERTILSVITTDELIVNVKNMLGDLSGSQKLISSIMKIQSFNARIVKYNKSNEVYRVVLIDYSNDRLNKLSQQYFKEKCKENNINIVKEARYANNMKIYRVVIDSVEEMKVMQSFEGIYSIEEAMPIELDVNVKEEKLLPKVKQPRQQVLYPVVGVLDSGIERNNYLSAWLFEKSEEYYSPKYQNKSHGSMVASILEYSDELNGTNYTSIDGVMMLEVVAVPDTNKQKVYLEEIIENIRDAIERHKDIKIWTMSIGTEEEAELENFSEWGMALDNIADENNVLIVKSAGNSKAYLSNKENERISKMSDSVRALVVGSIANEKKTI